MKNLFNFEINKSNCYCGNTLRGVSESIGLCAFLCSDNVGNCGGYSGYTRYLSLYQILGRFNEYIYTMYGKSKKLVSVNFIFEIGNFIFPLLKTFIIKKII